MRSSMAVARARQVLLEASTASPEAEARTLVAHVLGVEPAALLLAPDLDPEQVELLDDLVARRAQGVPVQHLTGEAWFRRVRLEVGPGVFIPRPETETMVGWALEQLRAMPERSDRALVVVELCAGSGAISKALVDEFDGLEVHAVELSDDALEWTRRNLEGTGVDLRAGDMATAFPELDSQVNLVIANPPYIPLEAWESVAADVRDHDPALALWSGDDGLDATHVVAEVAARLLRAGGLVCSEHAEVQEESVVQLFVDTGDFEQVRDNKDLTGRPRFVTAVRAARTLSFSR